VPLTLPMLEQACEGIGINIPAIHSQKLVTFLTTGRSSKKSGFSTCFRREAAQPERRKERLMTEQFHDLFEKCCQAYFNRVFDSIDVDGTNAIDEKDLAILSIAAENSGGSCAACFKFAKLDATAVQNLRDAVIAFGPSARVSRQEFLDSCAAMIRSCVRLKLADGECNPLDKDASSWQTERFAVAVLGLEKAQQQRTEATSRVFFPGVQRDALTVVQANTGFLFPVYYVIHQSVKKEYFFAFFPICLFMDGSMGYNVNLTFATMLTGMFTGYCKYIWRSPRPQWLFGTTGAVRRIAGVGEGTFATPSAHSSVLTCLACCVFWSLPTSAAIPATVASWALVGTSRMYFGVHYLQDVIIGGAIGAGIGAACMAWRPTGREVEGEYSLAQSARLLWGLLVFLQFFAVVIEVTVRSLLPQPSADLLEYWRVQMDSKHNIDPQSTRKMWYNLSFTSALLLGVVARICVWPCVFPGLNPMKNELPGHIWIFAIPINKFMLSTIEDLKRKLLRYKMDSALANVKRFGALQQFEKSAIMADLLSQVGESMNYAVIAFWTVFGFPLIIHLNVEESRNGTCRISEAFAGSQGLVVAYVCLLFGHGLFICVSEYVKLSRADRPIRDSLEEFPSEVDRILRGAGNNIVELHMESSQSQKQRKDASIDDEESCDENTSLLKPRRLSHQHSV